ncbi:hypothetical protein [Butyrivibrio hungatei]|uniref:Uncharacterized protein n=1 Tax=Butyrivibrio hungatei TaxID=185008 RepID=A0A1D9P748_9FIRM|nr:hypothetical protein [Butyrivibrio hungatei]AOZ97945.1 hypothetical protein bhn_II146 [Butyrivibrio hungatei]
MIGQKMNYKRYNDILKNMPAPITLDQIPKVKIDYKGLIQYAKSKNMQPGELSDEEKNMFFSEGKTMAWIRENAGYSMNVNS